MAPALRGLLAVDREVTATGQEAENAEAAAVSQQQFDQSINRPIGTPARPFPRASLAAAPRQGATEQSNRATYRRDSFYFERQICSPGSWPAKGWPPFSWGRRVRSRLLSTPLRSDAGTFSFGVMTSRHGLAPCARSRAHDSGFRAKDGFLAPHQLFTASEPPYLRIESDALALGVRPLITYQYNAAPVRQAIDAIDGD